MNRLELIGIIHEVGLEYVKNGREYYRLMIKIPRLSENCDVVPVIVKKELMGSIIVGSKVLIKGEIRTRDYEEDGKKKVSVYGYVREIENTDLTLGVSNIVVLDGVICKDTSVRTTITGRKITDLTVAHNRDDKKGSYYVPCITWGPLALRAERLGPGDNVSIVGRFQSRSYKKKFDGYKESYVAYEVSVSDYLLDGKPVLRNAR